MNKLRIFFLLWAVAAVPLSASVIHPPGSCLVAGLSFGSGAGSPCEYSSIGPAVIVNPDMMWASPFSNWISTSQDAVLRWNEPFNEVPKAGHTFYREFSLPTGGYGASLQAHADDNFNIELWNLDTNSLLFSYNYPAYCEDIYAAECSRWGNNPYTGLLGILDGGTRYRLSFAVHNLYLSSFGLDYAVNLVELEPAIPEPATWSLLATGLALAGLRSWRKRVMARRP